MSQTSDPRSFPPLPSLSDVDLRLLRVFHAVVRNGGFSAAQYELNMGQPAISAHMKQLEDRLGLRLCERGRSGFKLTEGGQVVYDALQKLFQAAEAFRNDVQVYKGELFGALYVAMDDALATNPKAPFREAFRSLVLDAPGVELHLSVAPAVELEKGLIEERFHLAIGPFHQLADSLATYDLYKEKQTLCCGESHPLFGLSDKRIKAKQLESALYAARCHMDGAGLMNGVAFRSSAYTSNMEALSLLILSGKYIGYLPRHFADPWIERGEMWPLAERRLSYDSQISVAARKTLDYPPASYLLHKLRNEPLA